MTSGSPLRRSITVVTAGNGLGQLALVLGVPFLVLIYPASVLGIFASLLGVSQILSVMSTLSVERILPRVEDGQRAAVLKVALLGTTLSAVAAVLGAAALEVGARNALAVVILLCTASFLRVAVHSCLSVSRTGLVGTIRATNGWVTAAAPLVFGLVQPSVMALAIGYSVGSAAATLLATRVVYRQWVEGSASVREVNRDQRLFAFATRVGPADLLTNAGATLPVIAVQALFGPAVAGTFYVVRRILTTPLQTISLGINESVYSHVAKEDPRDLVPRVRRWIKRGLIVSGILALCFMALAPIAQWWASDYPSITVTMIVLAVPLAVQATSASFSHLLLVQRRESARLMVSGARLVGLVVIFLLLDWLSVDYAWGLVIYGSWIGLVSLILLHIIARPVAET